VQGIQVDALQVDLAQYEGVEKFYDKIKSYNRHLDAIAINAGVGVGGDFTFDTELKAELNLININIVSAVHLAKLVVRDMVMHGEGRILFTSSIAAVMPAPFEAVYGASKAFLLSFSEALRNEIKDTGVTVTALMPGPTETNFFHRAGMDDTKVGAGEKDNAVDVAREGFDALMAGRDHVVAGSFTNNLEAAAAKILPETVSAAAHRRFTEPGSAPKH
jgi:short-subunit dehydrogenase